jgi:hypothetical protein
MARGADCVTTELTEVPAASWGYLELQKKYKDHRGHHLHASGEFRSMDLLRIFPYWPAHREAAWLSSLICSLVGSLPMKTSKTQQPNRLSVSLPACLLTHAGLRVLLVRRQEPCVSDHHCNYKKDGKVELHWINMDEEWWRAIQVCTKDATNMPQLSIINAPRDWPARFPFDWKARKIWHDMPWTSEEWLNGLQSNSWHVSHTSLKPWITGMLKVIEHSCSMRLYAAFNFWNSQLANAESITLLLQKGPWQAVSSPHTCRKKKKVKKHLPNMSCSVHWSILKQEKLYDALRLNTLHCSTKIMIYNPGCVWSWITASK